MNVAIAQKKSAYAEQSAFRRACILTLLAALFSFLGWVMETLLFLYLHREFNDRGLLVLPLCPIYGVSLLLCYALLKTPRSGFWEKWYRSANTKKGRVCVAIAVAVLYAACAALLATVTELITGFIYHRGFSVRLWNYHRKEDNFRGYICLRNSLLWGALIMCVMGALWYPLQNVFARAKTGVLATCAILIGVSALADFLFQMIWLYVMHQRFLPYTQTLSSIFPRRLYTIANSRARRACRTLFRTSSLPQSTFFDLLP